MRKGIWSATAFVALLSGMFPVFLGPGVSAADTTVKMVDGSGDPTTTWKFEPATITIAAGSSVVWHNDGQQAHTATGDGFDTDYVNGGKDSKPLSFPSAGRFEYHCTPHPWMKGVIVVTGGAATPTTAATTTTTQPSGTSPAPAPAGGTTTTTRAGATGAGQSTTTTTAPAAGGATSTTQAPSVTPTSAPETGGVTPATGAGDATEQAGEEHATKNASEKKQKNSPIGIAFAAVSTLLLAAIAGKLLASKP